MYGIELVPIGGSLTAVLSRAGVKAPSGASEGAIRNKYFSCIGQAPARIQGSRLTYAGGSRGSVANVTEHAVEGLGVQFAQQLIDEDAVASRHYLTTKAAGFLEALVQAYQRRSDLAAKYQLGLRVIPLLEQNAPEHNGPDTAKLYRAIQPYVVIPTFAGHANGAYSVNFDVHQKGFTEVENY